MAAQPQLHQIDCGVGGMKGPDEWPDPQQAPSGVTAVARPLAAVPAPPLIELRLRSNPPGTVARSGQNILTQERCVAESQFILYVPRSTRVLLGGLSKLFDELEAWKAGDTAALTRAQEQLMLACQLRTPNMSDGVHAGVIAVLHDARNWDQPVCRVVNTHLRDLQRLHSRLHIAYMWISSHHREDDRYLIPGTSLIQNRSILMALWKTFNNLNEETRALLLPEWICLYVNTQIRTLLERF